MLQQFCKHSTTLYSTQLRFQVTAHTHTHTDTNKAHTHRWRKRQQLQQSKLFNENYVKNWHFIGFHYAPHREAGERAIDVCTNHKRLRQSRH